MTYPMSHCGYCGKAYLPRRLDQTHCGKPCHTKTHNLEMKRGRQLYGLVMRMRYDRGHSGVYFKALCRVSARFHAEDVKAGRPLPFIYPEQVGQMGRSLEGWRPKRLSHKGLIPGATAV